MANNALSLDKIYDKPIVVSGSQATVNILLPAQPSTGYQWFLSNYDKNLVRVQSYRHLAGDTKKVGSVGTDEFKVVVHNRFKNAPQKQTLTFEYMRPWDPSDQPLTKTITILSMPENHQSKTLD